MKTPRWALVAVLAVLFAAVPAGGVSAGGPPIAPPGLEQAIAAQEAHTDALLARQGVVGTAVGVGANGQAVVKIYTESASVTGLPKRLDGVAVEVEVTGELVAQTTFLRPVPIGVSSGTERLIVYRGWLYCTVGTLGAWVKDTGGTVYALSNAHVYALQGSKPYGTVQTGSSGDRILQPGRVDMTAQACGSQSEINEAVIGRLWSYVPIVFSKTANNTVDAAIAKLLSTISISNSTPSGGYGTPSSTTAQAFLTQPVQKYGRTTGLTRGTVTGVNASVLVKYDTSIARFVQQVVIQATSESFSDGGDSGALIVTNDGLNSPVALLFAGSSSSTIGNPIGLVLGAFGVPLTIGP